MNPKNKQINEKVIIDAKAIINECSEGPLMNVKNNN